MRRVGVGKVRIAAIDQNVAGLEKRDQLTDQIVHRRAGLDHHHDPPRLVQRGDQLLKAVCADDAFAFRATREEIVDFGYGAVEDSDGVAVVGHVEDEVLAHDGKPDESNVSLGHRNLLFWKYATK